MATFRQDRINEELKKAISDTIQNDLTDPRLSSICSVTHVEVTKDLMHAKVGISVLGSGDEQSKTIDSLIHAAGFIAHETARKVDFRRVPKLHFQLDTSIEYSMHINEVLKELEKNDAE